MKAGLEESFASFSKPSMVMPRLKLGDVPTSAVQSEINWHNAKAITAFSNDESGSSYEESQAVAIVSNPQTRNVLEGLEQEFDFSFSDLTYLGTAFKTYLLCERTNQDSKKLVIVDFHAAHERCNYNLVRDKMRVREAVSSQVLLLPQTVNLDEESVARMEVVAELLRSFGFDFYCSGNNIVINAVPTMIKAADLSRLIIEIAELDLESEQEARLDMFIDGLAARIACHASKRAGDRLKPSDVYALFAQLDSAECRSACPHGRPIMIELGQNQIEGFFGR